MIVFYIILFLAVVPPALALFAAMLWNGSGEAWALLATLVILLFALKPWRRQPAKS